MKHVNIHEAKTRLSQLVAAAEAGEEIVIARSGKPVARLVPYAAAPVKRQFGSMKGRASTTDAFFEPLPDDELDAWGQ